MKTMAEAIYRALCPVCGGYLTVREARNGLCERTKRPLKSVFPIEKMEEFFEFFERALGSKPRTLQRVWARRVLLGDSFAAIAPTGIGKTVFGLVMSFFLAKEGKKSYIILPTTTLLRDVVGRAGEMASRLGMEGVFIYYHGNMKSREKEEFWERLGKGDFGILITTNAFLAKNFKNLSGLRFDFIFVDDVDSLLKNSRNVDRVLRLLGFTWDEISSGKRVGKRRGQLMVSTATGRRGRRTELFRALLNFDVGAVRNTLRNIVDVKVPERNLERLLGILERMGPGALIFAQSVEEAQNLYASLGDRLRVGLVTGQEKEPLDKFRDGELDYLIGVSFPYGLLVRGIDLPERIRYAVFYGIPRMRITLGEIDSLSEGMIQLLASLLSRVDEELRAMVRKGAGVEELRERLKASMGMMHKLSGHGIVVEGDAIVIPDVRTYIQASGRTSRLYSGGITRGASFVLDDPKYLEALELRASFFDIEFRELDEVDLDALREEIDRDRERLSRKKNIEERELIRFALFVVESPNKARQIARFFGRPNVRVMGDSIVYEAVLSDMVVTIVPTLGHMVDLPTRDRRFRNLHGVVVGERIIPIFDTVKRCPELGVSFVDEEYYLRNCKEIKDMKDHIANLRKLALESELVIIGTDPDTEGEKIAWDVLNLIGPFAEKVVRAEFHEVTRPAIERALREARDVDERMVEAQMVRRIEDRWLGFELSGFVTRLFSPSGNRTYSAGRVQSPVLGWIVERTLEARKRKLIGVDERYGIKLESPPSARLEVRVEGEVREEEREPLPPYTTDTMLADASRILRLSVGEAMALAQNLFEAGLITYHRTDSTRVSDKGLQVAKLYLKEKFVPRRWGKGGAHECIRPTRPVTAAEIWEAVREGLIQFQNGITKKHLALYDLIFRRFMASQMPPAKVTVQRVSIRAEGVEHEEERVIEASGGFYEMYPYHIQVRPRIPEGRLVLELRLMKVPAAPLYRESEIIAMMRERGIGRPSTYAQILEKLKKRGYVRVVGKGALKATPLGIRVYRALQKWFGDHVSEEKTRELEEVMDSVAEGRADYQAALREILRETMEIRRKANKILRVKG